MFRVNVLRRRLFADLRRWEGHAALVSTLREFPDVRIYVAGGCVRNLILNNNRPSKDFDLFLEGASVERAIGRLARCGDVVRNPFGSPRWYPDGPSGKYADLIPVRRFTNGWKSESMRDVLGQVDFTGNAVAFDLRDGALLDPHGGCRDLRLRIMRAIRLDLPNEPIVPGHPVRRPVALWFRILHYAAALDLRIEPQTLRWILENRCYRAEGGRYVEAFGEVHPDALRVLREPRGAR